ncbi:MAG: TetR/AcrR family transcriptional regulator [Pseudomonas sp.]|nr:TetR/AcrR family transcriptional regulator [Pseudomonas sp.]
MSIDSNNLATAEKTTGRIRLKNQEAILAAAAEEFACHGYKGTSMNSIALRVGLPKANLHYYFSSKQGLYVEVMRNILELWDSAFSNLRAEDDPATALAAYIGAKMEFSRRQPQASKIFAMEVISGGECMAEHFNQNYQEWFRGRAAVFQAWIDQGKMDPIDPVHLIFLLWGSTQHYADFSSSICRVSGRSRQTKEDFAKATANLTQIILKGCGLTPPAKA